MRAYGWGAGVTENSRVPIASFCRYGAATQGRGGERIQRNAAWFEAGVLRVSFAMQQHEESSAVLGRASSLSLRDMHEARGHRSGNRAKMPPESADYCPAYLRTPGIFMILDHKCPRASQIKTCELREYIGVLVREYICLSGDLVGL